MRRVQPRSIHAAHGSRRTVRADRTLEERTRRSYWRWTWLNLDTSVAKALSACCVPAVSFCVATPCDYLVSAWPDPVASCPVSFAFRFSLFSGDYAHTSM